MFGTGITEALLGDQCFGFLPAPNNVLKHEPRRLNFPKMVLLTT